MAEDCDVTRLGVRSRRTIVFGLVVTATVVVAIVWAGLANQPNRSLQGLPSQAPMPIVPSGSKAAILDDDANRSFWGGSEGSHPARIKVWVETLGRLGMVVSTIPTIADWGDELLVLPHTYCLSEEDLMLIEAGMVAGKGVLFVGPVGVRDRDGSWVGWNRFHNILGSSSLREFSGVETTFLVVSGTGPVGSLSDAGYRISMPVRGGQWGIAGIPGAAYWGDYLRKPFPQDEEFHAAGVGVSGAGRYAWVGFDPDPPTAVEDDQTAFSRLLADLVLWALSTPVSEVDLYPGGSRGAITIVMDTEWGFQNAAFLDTLLGSRGIRGGFMCVNELANENSELVHSLAQRHDIGSHSEDHSLFVGQSLRTQARRLRESAAGLAELTQLPVRGFRPPEEQYDEATLDAVGQIGLSYVLGGGATSVALPVLLQRPGHEEIFTPVVLISRIQRDDLYLANQEELSGADMSDALLEDWGTVLRHAGIHYVSVHSTYFDGPEKVAVLARFLDRVPSDNAWITGPNALADWWRNRSTVWTELQHREQGVLLLSVENRGEDSVEDVGIWVSVPRNPGSIRCVDDRVTVLGPDERGAFLLQLNHLAPKEALTLSLEVDNRTD